MLIREFAESVGRASADGRPAGWAGIRIHEKTQSKTRERKVDVSAILHRDRVGGEGSPSSRECRKLMNSIDFKRKQSEG